MITLIKNIIPPAQWRVAVIIVGGISFGILAYVFYISNAISYLSDKPETCVNCHIMAPEYATWLHSAHGSKTVCNDCHVPHNTQLNKYYFKAKDGLRHATIFTLRAEPQVIEIEDAGKKVVQKNCIRCHKSLIINKTMMAYKNSFNLERKKRTCWECHRNTPHGRVKGLSSTPYTRTPLLKSVVPEWIKNITN